MARTTTPIAGVDLTQTIAGTGTSLDQGNQFALGTRVQATDGQEYIYVHAAQTITQYYFVAVDENYEASLLGAAEAGDGWSIGVAQTALSNNDFGWVAVRGHNLTGAVAASCAADVAMYTSGSDGIVDDGTGGTALSGIVVVTSNGTTLTATTEVLLTYPRASAF